MNILYLILTIQAQSTNDDKINCILKTSRQRCQKSYTSCFQDIICTNQFEDLFEYCIIKPGQELYDDSCIATKYTLISNQLLSDMMNCFILECNLMNGKKYRTKSNLDLQTCIQEALTDASQCWILAQKCNQSCLKSLDQLQNCETHIEENHILATERCLNQNSFIDYQANLIKQCIYNQCIV